MVYNSNDQLGFLATKNNLTILTTTSSISWSTIRIVGCLTDQRHCHRVKKHHMKSSIVHLLWGVPSRGTLLRCV